MKTSAARKSNPAQQSRASAKNQKAKAKKPVEKKLKVVPSESGSAEDHAPAVDSLESNQVHLGQAEIEAKMGQTESTQDAQEPQTQTGSAAKKWWQRALENARK
jgi:hypothetical protein